MCNSYLFCISDRNTDSLTKANLLVYVVGGSLAFVMLMAAMITIGVFLKIRQKTSNDQLASS